MKNRKKGFFTRNSITKRWIFHHLILVLLVLVIIGTGLIVAVRAYFYGNATQYLRTKITSVMSMLHKYSENSDVYFDTELLNTVESFTDKDKAEFMLINYDGKIVITSSGFGTDYGTMPDYDSAISGGSGEWIGYLPTGEKAIAITRDISEYSNEYRAVRIISSLTEVDKNIRTAALVIICIVTGIFLLLVMTGMYFINSIVKPILEINRIAGKFATGDFSEKIPETSDDEIGELSEALNRMSEALKQTDDMKNEFISSVSHELRTPLTAIKGWAETIEYEPAITESPTASKGMKIIVKESDRLQGMVDELLDFSRQQTGHFKLSYSLVDILAELGDAVLVYEEVAKKNDIGLIYKEPEENLPLVWGDRNRIKQVFINIIDNAIKYSDPGGCVTVETAVRGKNIEVIVNDMGIGIKEEDLPKIKTKFYRADLTRRGSGIGLAVANEIVKLHHGTLNITSKPHVGTTVVVSLPYVDNDK